MYQIHEPKLCFIFYWINKFLGKIAFKTSKILPWSISNAKIQTYWFIFSVVPQLIFFPLKTTKILSDPIWWGSKNFSIEIFFEINSAMSHEHKITNFSVTIAKRLAWEMKQMVSFFLGRPVHGFFIGQINHAQLTPDAQEVIFRQCVLVTNSYYLFSSTILYVTWKFMSMF